VAIPSPVSNVLARIGRIESTFAPVVHPDPLGAQPSGDFEPFGDAYQRAVAVARPPVSASASTPEETTAVATRLPLGLIEARPEVRPTSWYGPSSAPGVTTPRIGGFGTMPVPHDLAPLGNGRISRDRL